MDIDKPEAVERVGNRNANDRISSGFGRKYRLDPQIVVDLTASRFGVLVCYQMFGLPAAGAAPFIRTTYPAPWLSRYLQAGYSTIDPIWKAAIGRITPFQWSDVDIPDSARRMMDEAAAYGVGPHGLVVPIVAENSLRGVCTMCSGDLEGWRRTIRTSWNQMIESAHDIHELASLEVADSAASPRLSAREIEVLRLIAKGWSSQDAARIMGVSYHTARAHVRAARAKLNCLTAAQAVAKAVAAGLIAQ